VSSAERSAPDTSSDGRATHDALLSAAQLFKYYGPQPALQDVTFSLGRGEILAVVGENGAGKSTLSKILAGVVQPDSGSLTLRGQPLRLRSPREAIEAGMSYIPQELEYLPNLTVADNLLVGRWPNRHGFTNRKLARGEAERLAARFGISLDVRRPITEMGLAERQLVEILKALARETSVLILDEPTAALTSDESKNLFRVVRGLAAADVGVIFISHRIDEVMDVAHRILVLRNGIVAAEMDAAVTTPREVIRAMLGTELRRTSSEASANGEVARPVVLRLEGWTRLGLPNIVDANLELREREILGLFGVRGSGADLIAGALGGRVGGFQGSMTLLGKTCKPFASPREAQSAGVGYVPPERKRDGLVLGMSIQANISMLVLDRVDRAGFIRRSAERGLAEEWRERLGIRSQSPTQEVGSLSGGNQQKVLLASRLATEPAVLVLNEPTRGVDVGTRLQIHEYVRGEARGGRSVLWVTSDVEEAVTVSDRLVIIRDGSIVGELTDGALTQGNAIALATGTEADE
jgi:ribose transport system ATP-binding protein